MDHRHLSPNEIDLLVDGEAGFGVAPLRAHLAECDDCRARYEELRLVTESLEALPHFSPRLRFTDAVMADVQVIEPWHVAVTESARRMVPASTSLRLLAGVGAVAAATVISLSAVWLAFRADFATWAFNLFVDRGREQLVAGASDVAATALGADASSALLSGGSTLILVSAFVALTAVGAAFGFRRLAATARAHRG